MQYALATDLFIWPLLSRLCTFGNMLQNKLYFAAFFLSYGPTQNECIFFSVFQHVIQVPIVDVEEEEENAFGTTEFAVTQDFGILRETVRPITMENLGSHSPKSKRQLFNSSEEQQNAPGSNLHELSL